MGGQERQTFPWGKWDWLSGGPCALGPPEAEKRRRLLQGALHLQLPQAVTRGFGTWQGPVAEVQVLCFFSLFSAPVFPGDLPSARGWGGVARAQTGSHLHGARSPGRPPSR